MIKQVEEFRRHDSHGVFEQSCINVRESRGFVDVNMFDFLVKGVLSNRVKS